MSSYIICNVCNNKVAYDADCCPSCGHKEQIKKYREDEPERRRAAEEAAKINKHNQEQYQRVLAGLCPKCGGNYKKKNKTCNDCGVSYPICKICGNTNPYTDLQGSNVGNCKRCKNRPPFGY